MVHLHRRRPTHRPPAPARHPPRRRLQEPGPPQSRPRPGQRRTQRRRQPPTDRTEHPRRSPDRPRARSPRPDHTPSRRHNWHQGDADHRRHCPQQTVQLKNQTAAPGSRSRCLGPASAARLRAPPRRSCAADSRAACLRGACFSSSSPKCAREMPDSAGWEQVARGQAWVTTRLPCMAVLVSRSGGMPLLIVC